MLTVFMLSVVMPNVIMLSVILMSVLMQSDFVLNIVMLCHYAERCFDECLGKVHFGKWISGYCHLEP
jgi:hypothetical protein